MGDGEVWLLSLRFNQGLIVLLIMVSTPDHRPVLDLPSALELVPSYLSESPDGQRLASLPAPEVAQLLVWFDRLGRDPALQEQVAALEEPEQLVSLAREAGSPISLAAAQAVSSEVELLDDEQLDQVVGGEPMTLALIGLGVAVIGLGAATFDWLSSRNNLETAKINAGVQTA
ncbi:MAG: hypothetical protein RLZZ336_1344 [Cyanobacteriota bacterium]